MKKIIQKLALKLLEKLIAKHFGKTGAAKGGAYGLPIDVSVLDGSHKGKPYGKRSEGVKGIVESLLKSKLGGKGRRPF